MLRRSEDPRSIRLRQAHDKAIVGGLECKRISTRQPTGADREPDLAHGPDFSAVMENIVRDRVARADAMEHEIIANGFAGQPGAAESGAEASRQRRGIARRRISAARRRPCACCGPSHIRRWHRDVGDDRPTGEEQRLDDRTLTGGSARQNIRIAKVLRDLTRVLRNHDPLGHGPADDNTC